MDLKDCQTKFKNQCLTKLSRLNFDKNCIKQEQIRLYDFMTDTANDIPLTLLKEAENSIDRKTAIDKINALLGNEILSMELEKGLFEYAMIHISTKKLQYHYCIPTYEMELYNICSNLDKNNKETDNQTLRTSILNYEINPRLVPFLSPQQVHPKRWLSIIQKRSREDQALTSVATYEDPENKCKNCGCIKFHSYEQQLRSADEPADKFIVCIDCGYTVMLR
jgi:DNA-directed RNA polymerase subunit M/transcription elongation factor TFIIS